MERLTTTKRRLTTLSSSRRAALERAKRTLAERGPPVGETDDLDRDEPYDHQRRSQLKELIANTIMSMVTLYNGNYRPVLALHDEPFPGLTGARPDATRLYADKEEEFTPQDVYDSEFSSYAGLFHRICWECDEGKDPHGNGPNYSEYNECSRGLRYVDIIDVDNPVVLLVLVVLPSPSRAWDGRTSVDVPPHSLTHSLTPSPPRCSVLNAELRMHARDERFSNSSRAVVRFACDYDADGFHLLNKSKCNFEWEKKMLALFDDDDKDPGKKHRSERLLRAYVFALTHPETRDRYAPDDKGLRDKPVKVLDPESLGKLQEVRDLPISAEEFHKKETEAFEIFRQVINGDGVRGYALAITDIMPDLLKLQKDDKVRDNAPMLGFVLRVSL